MLSDATPAEIAEYAADMTWEIEAAVRAKGLDRLADLLRAAHMEARQTAYELRARGPND